MSTEPWDVVTIGGGAAGTFASIIAGEARPGMRITILEATGQPLTKVRISGGGRCNVTHREFDPSVLVHAYPRGHRELRGPFSRFQPSDMIEWLKQHRVYTHTEDDGRVFPVGDESMTIVNCFRDTLSKLQIRTNIRTGVSRIEPSGGIWLVHDNTGQILQARRIILATGGSPQGHKLAAGAGHSIIPPVPSLFTVNIKDPLLEGLAGLSFLSIRLSWKGPESSYSQTGPALITHWGMSGPAMLKLSAWAARDLANASYQGTLNVSFVPDLQKEEILHTLGDIIRSATTRKVPNADVPWVPKRLWERLCEIKGCADLRCCDLNKARIQSLADALHESPLPFDGKSNNKEEFVTAGGVPLREVHMKTMESRIAPGLHFAGEVLDIDGITGGYNFQNAWTTGYLAGTAIADSAT